MRETLPGTIDPPLDGFHFDVPEATYRAWRAANWSWLKTGSSPNTMSHMEWDALNPDESESTEAQKFGTLWHRCLLEPSRARESYVVQPRTYPVMKKAPGAPGSVALADSGLGYVYSVGRAANRERFAMPTIWEDDPPHWAFDIGGGHEEDLLMVETKWSTNATWCKRWIADREAKGKDVVKAKDLEAAQNMCREIHKLPDFQRAIDGAKFEVSIVWTDPDTQIRCKARLDVWNPETGQIADAKKTGKSAAWDRFERDVWYYRYHCQMAMYRDGANVLLAKEGQELPSPGLFRLIVVEDWGGHEGAIYKMVDDPRAPTYPLFRDGRETYRGMLLGVKNANNDGYWPPHNPGPGGLTEEAIPELSDWMLGRLGEGQQI